MKYITENINNSMLKKIQVVQKKPQTNRQPTNAHPPVRKMLRLLKGRRIVTWRKKHK